MSLQIYNGFRLNFGKSLWDMLWWVEHLARQNINRALRAHYLELVETMDPDDEDYREKWALEKLQPERARSEQSFRLHRAHSLISESYRKNSTSSLRDTYSLDVSVAVYPHDCQFYLRTFVEPISVLGGVLDFVAELPELEDFHYQNSTDRPGSVSEADWDHRGDTWEEIFKHEGVGRHVALDICSWQAFYRIDPWFQLAREWHRDPPALPIREEVWARKLRKLAKLSSVVARPGQIDALAGETPVRIASAGERWLSTIGDVTTGHPSLNHAASHVEFEHLPDQLKEMVLRMSERSQPPEATT